MSMHDLKNARDQQINKTNHLVALVAGWHTGKLDTNDMIEQVRTLHPETWAAAGGNEPFHHECLEMTTCGTAHWTAERSLRIIENAHSSGLEVMSAEAMEIIESLSDRAGVYFAKRRIRPSREQGEDLPF